MDIDIKQLKSLMRALRRFDLAEIELRQGDEEIVLRRGGVAHASGGAIVPTSFPMTTGARGAPSSPSDLLPKSDAARESPAEDLSIVVITSPLVGTFYRAASPGSKAFVDVGSHVRAGGVLCIVEAMKLMNEIESEVDGVVVEILVENGRSVEFGDKLFKIKTGA